MYFISKGRVEILAQDKTLTTLRTGDFFGEIAILFKCTRTASVKAIKFTHVFVLKKEDLDDTLLIYPHHIPRIKEVAESRLRELHLKASPDSTIRSFHRPKGMRKTGSRLSERRQSQTQETSSADCIYPVHEWEKANSELDRLQLMRRELLECSTKVTALTHLMEQHLISVVLPKVTSEKEELPIDTAIDV